MQPRSSQQSSSRQRPLLVGREREQSVLRQALDNMLAVHGSLVLVSGEAGIGKTTLVEWLAGEAEDLGCLVLRGGCYDLTTTPPYGPWLEILERYEPGDHLPLVPPFVANADDLAGVGSQRTLFTATREFFREIAAQRPLLLVLEDLHWGDQTSIDLLLFFSRQLAHHRLLVVATYRTPEIHRDHPLYPVLPALIRESPATRVEVRPFDEIEQREFIRRRFRFGETDEARLATYLNERAEGNPFFAEELLRSLEDAGALIQRGDEWELNDPGRLSVPTLLRQVIEGRLKRLDTETRSLLQIGAIIGQVVSLELWQQVTGADDASLVQAISHGLRERVLEEIGTTSSYRFRHALIREALYEEVIALRRRHCHLAVAEALAASTNPDPDAVAYHFQQAGDPRCVEWLIEAGDRAQRGYAWHTAIERLESTLAFLPDDPAHFHQRTWLLFRTGVLIRFRNHAQSLAYLDEARQRASKSGGVVLEALAQAHLGLVRCYDIDIQQGLRDMEAGVSGLEQLDESQRQELDHMKHALGSTIGIQGRGTLALFMANQGDFLPAEAMLTNRRSTGPVDDADAIRAAAFIHAYLGRPDLARQSWAQCRQRYEAIHESHQASTTAACEYLLVQSPYGADQPEERLRIAQLAQELWNYETGLEASQADAVWAIDWFLLGEWTAAAEAFNHYAVHSPYSFSEFDSWRLLLALHRGQQEVVRSEIRRVLPNGPATEHGSDRYFVLADLTRIAIEQALSDGDLDDARSWLDSYDRLLTRSGAVLGRAENALLWGRYHDTHGRVERARDSADRALALASDPRQPLALIASHRFLGHLDTGDQRCDAAEQHLLESLHLAVACAAPFERALTLLELAKLRLAQQQLDEAASLLDEVQAICKPLGAKPTLERVESLRQRIPHTAKKSPGYPGGLSAREVEVLRLVAEGLTDAEIAEELFVSRRTITSHMTSIFNKLGVNARAAAVATAAREGLL
jgi:ATP/maltotriose-dependent transcriptional regulator MalT